MSDDCPNCAALRAENIKLRGWINDAEQAAGREQRRAERAEAEREKLRAERDKWKQQAIDDCESLQAERVERDALLDEAEYTMRMLQAEKCPSCYGGGTTPYGDQCEWCFRRDADCAHLKAAINAARVGK